MALLTYTVLLEPAPESGEFTVTVPESPGCITQGETREEALAMARDAIELYLVGEEDVPALDGETSIVATVAVGDPEKIPA